MFMSITEHLIHCIYEIQKDFDTPINDIHVPYQASYIHIWLLFMALSYITWQVHAPCIQLTGIHQGL